MSYAAKTKVPANQTRTEIETTLKRYGADQFFYGQKPGIVAIGFRAKGRHVRFTMAVPDETKQAQSYRQRWRAMLLCIKAKLESVESGIEQFDEAFMAQIILPDGRTMAEATLPQIAQAYKDGKMPPLLGFDK